MADTYQDASSTMRPAFPNSRLGSLSGSSLGGLGLESQLPGPPDGDAISTTAASSGVAGAAAGYNPLDDDQWWANAIEVDTFDSPLAFDASENGLWNGHFVPPPPRPPFLDESVAADGLTTCDLCTWAWQRNAYSLDGSIGESLVPKVPIYIYPSLIPAPWLFQLKLSGKTIIWRPCIDR